MKKLYTTEKIPNDCRECQYFHNYHDATKNCGLCNDQLPHCRIKGEEPWDDDQVIDCPLESLATHDVEVTKQVCKDLTNYILNKTNEGIKHV